MPNPANRMKNITAYNMFMKYTVVAPPVNQRAPYLHVTGAPTTVPPPQDGRQQVSCRTYQSETSLFTCLNGGPFSASMQTWMAPKVCTPLLGGVDASDCGRKWNKRSSNNSSSLCGLVLQTICPHLGKLQRSRRNVRAQHNNPNHHGWLLSLSVYYHIYCEGTRFYPPLKWQRWGDSNRSSLPPTTSGMKCDQTKLW